MRNLKNYGYVFRFHNLDENAHYELRVFSSREARLYFKELTRRFKFVEYFKQVL